MALNWVTIVAARPLLLQEENIIETVDSVKCSLAIPPAPSPSAMSGGLKKLEAVGTMVLTDQRVCTDTFTSQIHHDKPPESSSSGLVPTLSLPSSR